jgi:ferritin
MISEKLMKELNAQMNFEFLSGYYYMSMAAYAANEDLNGFANFFIIQGQEEYLHAMKFFNFIHDIDGRVTMQAIEEPINEYKSLVHVFEEALAHEKLVTKKINKLMDMAKDEGNHATISFLQWFIDEQVEEENNMKTTLNNLKRMDGNFQGIYMLDKELATRVLQPINPIQ